jgi:hypothetical protein
MLTTKVDHFKEQFEFFELLLCILNLISQRDKRNGNGSQLKNM